VLEYTVSPTEGLAGSADVPSPLKNALVGGVKLLVYLAVLEILTSSK
jgi:hypothetical protein